LLSARAFSPPFFVVFRRELAYHFDFFISFSPALPFGCDRRPERDTFCSFFSPPSYAPSYRNPADLDTVLSLPLLHLRGFVRSGAFFFSFSFRCVIFFAALSMVNQVFLRQISALLGSRSRYIVSPIAPPPSPSRLPRLKYLVTLPSVYCWSQVPAPRTHLAGLLLTTRTVRYFFVGICFSVRHLHSPALSCRV